MLLPSSFQSPCGDLVNRKNGVGRRRFDPLGFSPLAGIWLIESNCTPLFALNHTVFQSPCGDLVNRKPHPGRLAAERTDGFSPLAGIWLIESFGEILFRQLFGHKFQSPCGDLVNRKPLAEFFDCCAGRCFSPLAGIWLIESPFVIPRIPETSEVSVPLRGFG